MSLGELRSRIESRQAILGVVGLGYVGLTVACALAKAGFSVVGIDVKPDRVAMINDRRCPIEGNEPGLGELMVDVVTAGKLVATTRYSDLARVDVALIDVETPVDHQHRPQYTALESACRSFGAVMKEGVLVIVESTVTPGTTNQLVRCVLEETSGLVAGEGFYLGACPERVMPGRLLANLRTMNRVCGGTDLETAQTMAALYRAIVDADLDTCDTTTAELVKTAENAYRDVQIAFANEVALICEAVGVDVWRVRELVNKSPYRQMHLPGSGVGGHCIPKDPWLLAYAAVGGVPVRLIPAARAVNDQMPLHVADLVAESLAEVGIEVKGSRIVILGYAYLEDSDDARNSPSEVVVKRLREMGAEVVIHDPWIRQFQGEVLECATGCDAAVIMVAHSAYSNLDLVRLRNAMRPNSPVLVDGRHVLDRVRVREAGFVYRAVGQG